MINTEKMSSPGLKRASSDPERMSDTPAGKFNSLAKLLINTSKLIIENPEIKELDLNPVIVYEKGLKVVDARIILE